MAGPALTWTGPSGTVCPLDPVTGLPGYGWCALEGVKGLGAAPRSVASDPRPLGGASVRHVQSQPRLITLPLLVEGATQAEFTSRWRTLADQFASTSWAGPGMLTVTQPDGTCRLIDAYLQEGFDNELGLECSETTVVTLYCPDPFFRAMDLTLITRAETPVGVSFFSPFPQVSSSQTLGSTVVNNPGGVTAWPTWTLSGPATSLTASNATTAESFVLDVTTFHGSALAAGETVVVSTDPPGVLGPDGVANWTGALDWPSAVLWGLRPGDNSVSFVVGGSGAETAVEASFYARYETA